MSTAAPLPTNGKITPTKVPCHYCGKPILPDTAKRTGGYCMPHRRSGFADCVGGELQKLEEITQEKAESLLGRSEALDVLFSAMTAGDHLFSVCAIPNPQCEYYATKGVAVFRDGECILGLVTVWAKNPAYFEDTEEEVSEDAIACAFQDEWPSIKERLPSGVRFVYFSTSPLSWHCLAGRAGYTVMKGDQVLYSMITVLN